MKRIAALILVLLLVTALPAAAFAEDGMVRRNAVRELYSTNGVYTDGVGNTCIYSYHVPQIDSDTEAAAEINAEISERFGERTENQFHNMEEGYSLWMTHTGWEAFWNGPQLFLLVTSDEENDFKDYAAYGYDFETGTRMTNEGILRQLGISGQEYLDSLHEKVRLLFEDMYGRYSEKDRKAFGYDSMLEDTLGWADLEQPIYIDASGSVVTIVKIASIAGAGWYYHLVTPFAYG